MRGCACACVRERNVKIGVLSSCIGTPPISRADGSYRRPTHSGTVGVLRSTLGVLCGIGTPPLSRADGSHRRPTHSECCSGALTHVQQSDGLAQPPINDVRRRGAGSPGANDRNTTRDSAINGRRVCMSACAAVCVRHETSARCGVRVGVRQVPAQRLARKSPVPKQMWDEGEPPSARADADSSPGADAAGRSCGGKRCRFMGIRELMTGFRIATKPKWPTQA